MVTGVTVIRNPIGGRLQDVLDAVAQLQHVGELVTLQRVASQLNLPRQNIWRYVRQIQKMGLIVYQPTERYTSPMHLSEAGWWASRASVSSQADLRLPVLREIAAGQPILAVEQLKAHVTRLQEVLNLHAGDSLLRVRGDSMIGIGIYPSDLGAIHPQAEEPCPVRLSSCWCLAKAQPLSSAGTATTERSP